MRIGVSLLNLRPGKMGGIETYLREMAKHLASMPDADIVFFVNKATRSLVPQNGHVCLLDWSLAKTTGVRLLEAFSPWRARRVERLVDSAGIDVMFYPHQAMFPKNIDVPNVMTVVDVQHLFIPEYFSRFDREFRKRAYADSLLRCSAIAAISQVTADSLVEKCGVPPAKIAVIQLGCDQIDPSSVGDSGLVNEPYLYYPAASFRHKGHLRLFQSFAELKRGGNVSQKLVLTGMRTAYWQSLEQSIKREGLEGEVIHLGYLPYGKILSMYKGADAVLFPTEFEGFGLPVLEAVQFNKKVICSQLPVFDEIGVPKEWQIDYEQPEQLLRALEANGPTRLLHAPNTWHDTAKQTMELLVRTALGSKLGG